MKIKRSRPILRRPLTWVVIAVIIVLATVAGAVLWQRMHDKTQSPAQPSDSQPKLTIPTHPETSEGQTFPVPDNVPPGSVKNYELVTENERFKIRRLDNAYTITLYAIINNPSQRDSYTQQLHDYKQEALTYLNQHGVDTAKVTITYDPAEAANY